MKFKEDDILYYVNPFIFEIDKVQITMVLKEHDGIYYIDHSGAYLKEEDLFIDLHNAKQQALYKLNGFIDKKRQEITNADPEIEGF